MTRAELLLRKKTLYKRVRVLGILYPVDKVSRNLLAGLRKGPFEDFRYLYKSLLSSVRELFLLGGANNVRQIIKWLRAKPLNGIPGVPAPLIKKLRFFDWVPFAAAAECLPNARSVSATLKVITPVVKAIKASEKPQRNEALRSGRQGASAGDLLVKQGRDRLDRRFLEPTLPVKRERYFKDRKLSQLSQEMFGVGLGRLYLRSQPASLVSGKFKELPHVQWVPPPPTPINPNYRGFYHRRNDDLLVLNKPAPYRGAYLKDHWRPSLRTRVVVTRSHILLSKISFNGFCRAVDMIKSSLYVGHYFGYHVYECLYSGTVIYPIVNHDSTIVYIQSKIFVPPKGEMVLKEPDEATKLLLAMKPSASIKSLLASAKTWRNRKGRILQTKPEEYIELD
jgi:hypothetical protein